MKKFLLLMHENLESMQSLSPKEMEELVNAHLAWAQDLTEKGMFLGGDGLHDGGKQIVGKNCIVKDGPYIESKEMIGGYYLVQANSIEEITEIAKNCPCHLYGGTTEIRGIMDYD